MLHKSCIAVGVCLAIGAAIADINDWVFDTSERAEEMTSSGSASLSSALESRSVDVFSSPATGVDSRCGDSETSNSTALDSTKVGFCIILN